MQSAQFIITKLRKEGNTLGKQPLRIGLIQYLLIKAADSKSNEVKPYINKDGLAVVLVLSG